MEKLLLTVAVVVASAATTHTRSLDTMLGRWCPIKDGFVYTRTNRTDIADCVKVEQERFYWHDWDCKVDEKIRTGRDTYLFHARCKYAAKHGHLDN